MKPKTTHPYVAYPKAIEEIKTGNVNTDTTNFLSTFSHVKTKEQAKEFIENLRNLTYENSNVTYLDLMEDMKIALVILEQAHEFLINSHYEFEEDGRKAEELSDTIFVFLNQNK